MTRLEFELAKVIQFFLNNLSDVELYVSNDEGFVNVYHIKRKDKNDEIHIRIYHPDYIKGVLIPILDSMVWHSKNKLDYED